MALEAKYAKGSPKHVLWQLILASLGYLSAPSFDLTGTMRTIPPRSLSVSDEAWLVFDALEEP